MGKSCSVLEDPEFNAPVVEDSRYEVGNIKSFAEPEAEDTPIVSTSPPVTPVRQRAAGDEPSLDQSRSSIALAKAGASRLYGSVRSLATTIRARLPLEELGIS